MAVKNKLGDLNNHLFETLERLNDDTLMSEDLEKEISRAGAITRVGKTIIDNGALMLSATMHADEYGYNARDRSLPETFRLSNGKDSDE